MKLVQQYGALTIETDITQERFAKAQRYAPASLKIVEDKKELFAITKKDSGSISQYGIAFDSVGENGKLYVTIAINTPENLTREQRKQLLEEEFGMILHKLAQVEMQVAAALSEADTMISSVTESIVII